VRFQNVLINGEQRLAVEMPRGVVPLPPHVEDEPMAGMDDAIRVWAAKPPAFRDHITQALADAPAARAESIAYRPVVEHPGKILCIGLNYRQHALETGQPIPAVPVVFGVFQNALAAHEEVISIPEATHQVDYEGELTIIIGRFCAKVSADDALDYVFGYTAGNDVSARDLQNTTSQWLIGKSLDQFAPMGPTVVTADALDPGNLDLTCRLNGEVRQASNTSDMIFSCAELISYLSHVFPLRPGDLIMTGTPSGVILGLPPEERRWIQPGDRLETSISGIGTLVNTFA
jgi:2-keto-4-pentenoate hydratase/2-oxohepta-3-ene-1,7-dioic acid hydratase in catechol pathway